MKDKSNCLNIKQISLRLVLFFFMATLVACGTPHSVSSFSSLDNVSGSHVAGAFSIKRVQLDINGHSSKTINKNEALNRRAVIKYQGSGVFQAQWLLDGRVIKQVNKSLNHGSVLTLTPKAIKTAVVGRHVVQLKITQPVVNFKIPELTFFVAQ